MAKKQAKKSTKKTAKKAAKKVVKKASKKSAAKSAPKKAAKKTTKKTTARKRARASVAAKPKTALTVRSARTLAATKSAAARPIARGTSKKVAKKPKTTAAPIAVEPAPVTPPPSIPPGSIPEAPAPQPKVPAIGERAPAFTLPSSTGASVSLGDYAGKTVVLYFYPKADTPGCTVQACAFRDSIADYGQAGLDVIGISPDPVEAVTDFAKKFNVNFPLLADADHAVCEKYGVWVEKSMYGKTYMGTARTTFIIKDGVVSRVFEKVNPEGHEKEILASLEGPH